MSEKFQLIQTLNIYDNPKEVEKHLNGIMTMFNEFKKINEEDLNDNNDFEIKKGDVYISLKTFDDDIFRAFGRAYNVCVVKKVSNQEVTLIQKNGIVNVSLETLKMDYISFDKVFQDSELKLETYKYNVFSEFYLLSCSTSYNYILVKYFQWFGIVKKELIAKSTLIYSNETIETKEDLKAKLKEQILEEYNKNLFSQKLKRWY